MVESHSNRRPETDRRCVNGKGNFAHGPAAGGSGVRGKCSRYTFRVRGITTHKMEDLRAARWRKGAEGRRRFRRGNTRARGRKRASAVTKRSGEVRVSGRGVGGNNLTAHGREKCMSDGGGERGGKRENHERAPRGGRQFYSLRCASELSTARGRPRILTDYSLGMSRIFSYATSAAERRGERDIGGGARALRLRLTALISERRERRHATSLRPAAARECDVVVRARCHWRSLSNVARVYFTLLSRVAMNYARVSFSRHRVFLLCATTTRPGRLPAPSPDQRLTVSSRNRRERLRKWTSKRKSLSNQM